MRPKKTRPTIAADEVGIYFLHCKEGVVVEWGEIADICAFRENYADGTPFIQVFVDHYSGVDFGFKSDEVGFAQTTTEMEKRLYGFKKTELESVRSFEEEGQTIPMVWKRDEAIQPFQLRPPMIDPREPTPAERKQMKAAHRASIATCEKILGRRLTKSELVCVETRFENGRIA